MNEKHNRTNLSYLVAQRKPSLSTGSQLLTVNCQLSTESIRHDLLSPICKPGNLLIQWRHLVEYFQYRDRLRHLANLTAKLAN